MAIQKAKEQLKIATIIKNHKKTEFNKDVVSVSSMNVMPVNKNRRNEESLLKDG